MSVDLEKTNFGIRVTYDGPPARVIIKSDFAGKTSYEYALFEESGTKYLDYSSDVWKLGSLKAIPLVPSLLSKKLRQGEHATPPKGKPKERSSYAIPGKYAFPIHDAAHVKAAESYFHKHDFASHHERRTAAIRILRAAKKHGVKVAPDSMVSRAAKGDHVAIKTVPWKKSIPGELMITPTCVGCYQLLVKEGPFLYWCPNCEIHVELRGPE